jgi:hypothetical protein
MVRLSRKIIITPHLNPLPSRERRQKRAAERILI